MSALLRYRLAVNPLLTVNGFVEVVMEYILLFETWIVVAIILGLLEIVVPGGILMNLAIASLLVAIGVHQQFINTWVSILTTWFILATFLLIIVYFITEKFFSGNTKIENIHEELDIYGEQVNVIEQIGPGTHAGRVEYQGTTWTALSDGSVIDVGNQATIVCKENISLIVEPVK